MVDTIENDLKQMQVATRKKRRTKTMVVKRELDFSDLQRECWSGAVDTLQTIWEHDKEDEFMNFLEGYFADCNEVPTMTEVNDLLWFEDEWIFEQIDLDPDEDDDDDDEEDEDDDWDNNPTIDNEHDGDRFDFPERF